MNGKRQTNQQRLASGTDGRGETPAAATGGAEPSVAMPATESPAFPERLMEEVCSRKNLQRAWKRVQGNKGGPGVDGMTIDVAKAFLREHWPAIRLQLAISHGRLSGWKFRNRMVGSEGSAFPVSSTA